MPLSRGSDKGIRTMSGPDHSELTAEMAMLAKLPMPERLRHARKRRAQQLKDYAAYERQIGKDTVGKSKNKKGGGIGINIGGLGKRQATINGRTHLQFADSILLLDAVGRNDISEVKQLLSSGVNPNAANSDSLTALHQCCIDNLEEMACVLVNNGADVNFKDIELWTPLHAAATCGHVGICRYLVEHGAELLAVNGDGNMPYDICEEVTTLDFIETEMSNRGVTQELIEETRATAETRMLTDLRQMVSNGMNLECRGSSGETSLHIAACNGYEKVATFLLDHRVSVDVADNDSWQPVHCAACWGQLSVFTMLLERGASSEAKTQYGETPLDVCDDLETRQRIIEIISELAARLPSKSLEVIHRGGFSHGSSRRTSNASPASHACMRRSSLHERASALAMSSREAQEEALRLREPVLAVDDEDDEDESAVELSAITVDPSKTGAKESGSATVVSPMIPSLNVVESPCVHPQTKSTRPTSSPLSLRSNEGANSFTNKITISSGDDKIRLSPGSFPLITNVLGSGENNPTSQSLTETPVSQILSSNGKYSSKIKTSASIASAATHSSSGGVGNRPNSFSPNGTGRMASVSKVSSTGTQENTNGSGTLMELKRRRAGRNHGLSLFCLDSKENNEESLEQGRGPTKESCSNVDIVHDNRVLISNGTLPHSSGEEGLRHKFVNNDEVVHGETNGCCVVM